MATCSGSVIFTFEQFEVELDPTVNNFCEWDGFSIGGVEYCGNLPGKTVCKSATADSKVEVGFYSDDFGPSAEKYSGFRVKFETFTTGKEGCIV